MKRKQFTLGEVASRLGLKPYRINYAIVTGLVPEPETRLCGKRIFGPTDVKRLARHFGVELKDVKNAGKSQ